MIRDLAVAALVGSVTLLLISLAFGPEQVFNQVVRYRQGSMAVEKWSLGENWRLISDELIWEQTGFYA